MINFNLYSHVKFIAMCGCLWWPHIALKGVPKAP